MKAKMSQGNWVPVCLIIIVSMTMVKLSATAVNSAHHHHHGVAFSHGERSSLIMKMIHRDSLESPFYNPNETISDRADRNMKLSKARATEILQPKTNDDDDLPNARVDLIPGTRAALYFLHFYISDVSNPQYAAFDTGSDLLWVMCSPCTNCHKTKFHYFKPTNSPTYTPLTCTSYDETNCTRNRGWCNSSNSGICKYRREYVNGHNSSGILATDTLLFTDQREGDLQEIEEVVFGCATAITYIHPEEEELFMGIFGFSANSFFTKTIETFSYCIGNGEPDGPEALSSHLAIGRAAILRGRSTPFNLYQSSNYAVNMQGIKVGTYDIKFSKERAIIDSGASLTLLRPQIYAKFVSTFDSVANKLLTRYSLGESIYQFCYKGDINRAYKKFPQITFSFPNNVELVARPENFFTVVADGIICLHIISTESMPNMSHVEASLIGFDVQKGHNIGFDVTNKLMFIDHSPCRFL